MGMPTELKQLELFIEKFRYQPSAAGLLRIAGWTFVFLLLVSFTTTPQQEVPTVSFVTMNTTASDLQWVRNDLDYFPSDNILNIAWVSGSSINLGYNAEFQFLPQYVNQLLSREAGIASRDFVYNLNARRILDTYTMVQDALLRKPDAMVLVINPFWVFNSKAVFYKKNIFNQGAKLWWNATDWLWQFTLTAPANHLFNLIGRHIPVLAKRRHYIKKFREKSRALLGFSLIPNSAMVQGEFATATYKLSQPLQFWLLYQSLGSKGEPLITPGMTAKTWQLAAISLADTDSSSWPVEIMHKMLTKIKHSGIPTLLYVAPVSPDLQGLGARHGYNAVLNAMDDFKREYQNDKLRFIVRLPEKVADTITFKDYLHLKGAGKLPAYLSRHLSEIVSIK